ncbi:MULTISPECIES: hypothetical protein [Sphingobacterium]|uniref:Uncharacterized protein n=2 Tax=Sphingobacterium TaxID=28453 RepID=A0A4R6WED5_9SPHI|nr:MULTISPECIES: hypothetical protein [Sphingobacterium]TDQ78152.1 hypothetical protein CLV99_2130 [Sphingobacterium yanglingense]
MEQLLHVLIQQQKKHIKLNKNQNKLITMLIAVLKPTDKERLKSTIMDNADLKEIFKVADTKFYRIKKLFRTYELDTKDYYLADEILEVMKKNERGG